jgi:hypothetical protein
MDVNRELSAQDLYALYGDYVAAHATRQVAERYAEEGPPELAERWRRMADDRLGNIISDKDALEINVHIGSRLQRDRLEIVSRLRGTAKPLSWTMIGQALGMTKQAAHEWFHRAYRRPYIPNPTDPSVKTP